MKNYQLFFKSGEVVPIVCEGFEAIYSQVMHPGGIGSYREINRFKFFGENGKVADIFASAADLAAIVPLSDDPGAPGFQMYLKNIAQPVTVKAARCVSGLSGIEFFAAGEKEAMTDIYVARAEVLAIVPEDVAEGEA